MTNKKSIKYYILAGIFSIVPITVTYWIVLNLFQFFAKPGKFIVEYFFYGDIPKLLPEILGFTLTIISIYIIGLIVSNVIGKQLYNLFENILSKIPIINTVYKTAKQITNSITGSSSQAFKKVVLLEYPRKGVWTITMVTGESLNSKGELFYHIFVPTTPNPTSGFMLYVPKTDAVETKMSVEEGLKILISGGLLAPKNNPLP